MDSYEAYKKGRDKAWEALVKSGISSLPVALDKVAAAFDIDIISMKKAGELGMPRAKNTARGVFAVIKEGRKTVVVDESAGEKGFVRFLMAKGIGYCLLAGNPLYISEAVDYGASIFARDLLMPATVLSGLGVEEAGDIERICLVSAKSAESRAKRMADLYKRNRFNEHPLEKAVRENFERFILETKR